MFRSRTSIVLVTLLALAAAARFGGFSRAEGLVRFSHDSSGESRPITIDADEIATWVENDHRVLHLRGQVLVQHGIVRVRLGEGVALVNLKDYEATRVWKVELYGEGNVSVQNGSEVTRGSTACIDLHTRGDLKLNAHRGKIRHEAQPSEAIIQRAFAQRQALASRQNERPEEKLVEAGPLRQASHTAPAAPTQGPAPPAVPVPLGPPVVDAPASPPPPGAALQGILPGGLGAGAGPAPIRHYSIIPRSPAGYQSQVITLPGGEKGVIVTGGFVLNVRSVEEGGRLIDLLDIEADRLVLWTRGDPQQLFSDLRASQGTQTNRELEFYLAGNVEIRSRVGTEERTLRAEEVYYDVGRNVAVAVGADLEFRQPGFPDPVHFRAAELEQLSPTQFRALDGEFFSSRLPSDPGLKVVFTQATLEERRKLRRSIFGPVIDRRTGEAQTLPESFVRAEDVFLRVEDVPVLYLPSIQGDARDPLGPIESINLGWNRIFGGQFGVGLDVYDLLGLDPLPGTRWRADIDYLTRRGPAAGTIFDFAGSEPFGVAGLYTGQVRLWGIYDTGTDILGGDRGENDDHPDWRGRAEARTFIHELPWGFSVQGQVVGLSDKNVYEQFFKREWDEDPNKETFLYVKQQQGNWAWTLLGEVRLRDWLTETEWLPRADGYLLGMSPFGLFTHNIHASAGYARLMPTDEPPPPFMSTDQRINTGRFDVMQELALPFSLGPVKVVPYGVLDLTHYTEDLNGDQTGRVYGGGGVRASIPFSRLYPDVQSELFYLSGINHKIVLAGNYYNVASNERFSNFPQLDRLLDDATDQSQRDIRPLQPALNPANGVFLSTSSLFDPQVYAIRRTLLDRIDTLDQVEVVQLDLRQRWQTKRGFPGRQHIIDWMTLDLSGSIFPRKDRDNFGETFAFLEYDWAWNIGDRTSLVSTGWVDPIDDGPRVFTIGAFLNRPDRTLFYLGYRIIEPVGSRAVSGAVSYIFSPKYAMTASSVYDFGTSQSLANSLVLTRMGTDLQVSLGFTYNAMQNNFGVTFEILPNLVAPGRRLPGLGVAQTAVGP